MQTPRTEFAQALRAIASERGLEADVILDTIKQAIIAAYKRDAREAGVEVEEMDFDVELNPTNGEAKVFAWPLEKPKERKDVTPPGFGRIAAQTAKQVIHQKIREAEKGAIMDEYSGRIGALISGMILRFDGPDVRVDLGRTEGIMPKEERVPNERLNPNQRLTFLFKDIRETLKGKQLILSRGDTEFVKKLFEREVPEMSSGSVEVKAISREAGVRTKMAVSSNQSGVDPVGSCVGQKGVRVQAVTNELGGERVDIIQYTDDLASLIKAALSPAENLSVKLDEKTKIAIVKAPEDQLSLAIGKDGQNARLAAKLTGWKIEIKEAPTPKGKSTDAKTTVDKEEKEIEPASELEKVEKKEIVSDDSSKAIQTVVDDTNKKSEDKKDLAE
ncbi:transcription termination factor NusA [Candidatus Woesebacteria bacterium RIFCSPHIGHO2_01_FULL_39_32]|uniref:Transcription termination/antitermination protein NusA n=1 Tax=Candidatus Woesebacteria bacterium RIFCSPLOWO2_01_FULL_39_25 TaxID=1802521 RepID=A0A1F8BKM6_9BACT|nr:MAG: transcription termination factor NusA [Candidatus Woesebacteria bacterium GWB1_37_5]OGM24767.1 MAG: transcription termination factor NusA [Candidatus Woesebacteria bacterium RIFCSPHIGHO2_01_FULL_39_32]OGM64593.1 MAG: transcription termination factor NusA [Candidatus Woesebacteria bacterium RIFCSPLOWO2_01_FULL_39_25]